MSAALIAVTLAACGGGGGHHAPPTPPAPAALHWSSSALPSTRREARDRAERGVVRRSVVRRGRHRRPARRHQARGLDQRRRPQLAAGAAAARRRLLRRPRGDDLDRLLARPGRRAGGQARWRPRQPPRRDLAPARRRLAGRRTRAVRAVRRSGRRLREPPVGRHRRLPRHRHPGQWRGGVELAGRVALHPAREGARPREHLAGHHAGPGRRRGGRGPGPWSASRPATTVAWSRRRGPGGVPVRGPRRSCPEGRR